MIESRGSFELVWASPFLSPHPVRKGKVGLLRHCRCPFRDTLHGTHLIIHIDILVVHLPISDLDDKMYNTLSFMMNLQNQLRADY